MKKPAKSAVRLRIYLGGEVAIGPGRAELLQLIGDTGSIAEAARAMEMSYRRAWALVQSMNALFKSPLVERTAGGAGGGGARLTPAGRAVLEAYADAEREARTASTAPVRRILRRLR